MQCFVSDMRLQAGGTVFLLVGEWLEGGRGLPLPPRVEAQISLPTSLIIDL